jgi:hypothetical protein
MKVDPVVVVGGGIMGQSIACYLAKNSGAGRVVLVDASHSVRGSWGESRFAHLFQRDALYFDMARESFQLWDELAEETGELCTKTTGRLQIGAIGSMAAGESNLKTRGVEYQKLQADQVNARFPAFQLDKTEEGILVPSGRLCLATNCVQAFSAAAAAQGAVLVEDTVVSIDRANKCILTDSGKKLRYSKLVLSCGPWTNKMLGLASPPLAKLPIFVSNEQTINFGFKAQGQCYDWNNTPISGCRYFNKDNRLLWFYIAPHVSGGIGGWKVGLHQQGSIMSTEDFQLDRPAAAVPTLECSIRNHVEFEQVCHSPPASSGGIYIYTPPPAPSRSPSRLSFLSFFLSHAPCAHTAGGYRRSSARYIPGVYSYPLASA